MHRETAGGGEPLVRVMALHALAYCERLFYLEEVEEIRVADDRVYAGRTLHEREVDTEGEWRSLELESEAWGLRGKVDYVRYRDGGLVAFEHKRGRSRGDDAWPSDELQVTAYCALLEEHFERSIGEGRIRYHANNHTVRIAFDDARRDRLRAAVARARALAHSLRRPPVAENENLCARCSLAPVCLPEEERLLAHAEADRHAPQRLFPPDDERQTVHVTEPGSRVGRSGYQVVVTPREGPAKRLPLRRTGALVLHGAVQISAQMLHFAAANDVAVHWLSGSGRYVGGLAPPGGVQRRLRQYRALQDAAFCTDLARTLVQAKVENQLRLLLRTARNRGCRPAIERQVVGIRGELRAIAACEDPDRLRGHEGRAGRYYFAALPQVLDRGAEVTRFAGRNRRPPQDGFNALLSFGYALLYRDVLTSIHVVGLEPALGFFHRPRSAAWPLALDLMELFRTVLWDLPLIASVNRRQWRDEHFRAAGRQVWLSADGRRQAIGLYEGRKQERWRHPVLQYSLSYARAIELETRLLEKEWSGSPGLFARMRLR